MKRILFVCACSLLLASCITNHERVISDNQGSLKITYELLSPGSLAKQSTTNQISLKQLSIKLFANGEDTLQKTIDLNDISLDFSSLFTRLAAKQWTLLLTTSDSNDSIIHQGSYTVNIVRADTVKFYASLNSQFSQLKSVIGPIPLGTSNLSVSVNGVQILDSSFSMAVFSSNGIKVSYDYLPASPQGSKSVVDFVFSGQVGDSNIVYSGSIEVLVISGKKQDCQLVLVRSSSLIRDAFLSTGIKLDSIGEILVNVSFPQSSNIFGKWNIDQTQPTGNKYYGILSLESLGDSVWGYMDWNNHTDAIVTGTKNGNRVVMLFDYKNGLTGMYYCDIEFVDGSYHLIRGTTGSNGGDYANWFGVPTSSR